MTLTDDEIAERLYAAGVPRGRNTHEAYRLGWEARGKQAIDLCKAEALRASACVGQLAGAAMAETTANALALAIARAGKDRAC